ncbi:MAG: hypothetical protein NTV63_05695 [Candidatus Woesearchaeota archaeon]|nr:hypothetical protein [Candidatus Woesearchaeota archaeon]
MLFGIMIFLLIAFAAVVILSFFFKFFRAFVKLASIAGFIIIACLLINSFFIYKDFQEFRERNGEQILFLLKDGKAITSAFSTSSSSSSMNFIGKEGLAMINRNITKRDYASILDSNYKIFTIGIDALERNLGNETMINEQTFSKDSIIEALKSDNSSMYYVLKMLEIGKVSPQLSRSFQENIAKNIGDSTSFKAVFFSTAVGEIMKNQPLFIVLESSSGGLSVYPETPLFSALRMVPSSMLKGLFEKSMGKAVSRIQK